MTYAYLDKYGILHIVDNEKTAKEYSGNGEFTVTEIPNDGGYPTTANGEHIIVYTKDNKFKVGGVEMPMKNLASNYPTVDALVKELV